MTDASGTVLCVNSGSSSLKAALFRGGSRVRRLETGLHAAGELEAALDRVVGELLQDIAPDVVGHRVVHGGPDFSGPVLVDTEVLEHLRDLIPLAPLHQPAAIAGIELLQRRLPGVPEVACFDTAFHHRLPERAQRLPLPGRYHDAGVRRYGFHGLSYDHVVGSLGDRLGRRSVVAHLGSGASLVALLDGAPVDTTMSLTPGGGLVMATRSGDLDPGVVLRLLELEGDAPRVAAVLESESGMSGISGSTGDFRALLASAPGDPRVAAAIDSFVASAAKHVASLSTVLGGLDTLVFTGGIGAHSPVARAAIAERLGHLGVTLDAARNEEGCEVIGTVDASCAVLVVPADEEATIASQALALVAS